MSHQNHTATAAIAACKRDTACGVSSTPLDIVCEICACRASPRIVQSLCNFCHHYFWKIRWISESSIGNSRNSNCWAVRATMAPCKLRIHGVACGQDAYWTWPHGPQGNLPFSNDRPDRTERSCHFDLPPGQTLFHKCNGHFGHLDRYFHFLLWFLLGHVWARS